MVSVTVSSTTVRLILIAMDVQRAMMSLVLSAVRQCLWSHANAMLHRLRSRKKEERYAFILAEVFFNNSYTISRPTGSL